MCDECGIEAAEYERLKQIEDRLTLAIEAHTLFIDNIENDPYKAAVLSKQQALEFTLGILNDIRE